MKPAREVPMNKSGKKSIRENDRPRLDFGKVFERVVPEPIYIFMGKKDLFYSRKFDFRQLSLIHALSETIEMIRDNSNLRISGILFFSQNAFGTIKHENHLYNLEAYGVRGLCLDWFTSYPSGRSQCLSNHGEVSNLYVLTVVLLNDLIWDHCF